MQTTDAISHDAEQRRIVQYLCRLGNKVKETGYYKIYSGDELYRIQNTYDDLDIQELRAEPDLQINTTRGKSWWADIKTGHALEAFQLAFNIKRMQKGETVAYILTKEQEGKDKVLVLDEEIFSKIKPVIYYHPERPHLMEFLKETLQIRLTHELPWGHNSNNGRSKDPCIYLKSWVYDELRDFESFALDMGLFG